MKIRSQLTTPQVAVDRNIDNTVIDKITVVNANIEAITTLAEAQTVADMSSLAGLDFTAIANQVDTLDGLTVSVVETLAAGEQATAELVGNVIQLRIPKGLDGTNGTTPVKGEDYIDGIDGDDGKSAYESAIYTGYVGTETEWIDSLKGAKGDTGNTGNIGATGDSLTLTSSTNNGDGTFTLNFSDGSSHITEDLTGATGSPGVDADPLEVDSVAFAGDETMTIAFSDGSQWTSPSLRGNDGRNVHHIIHDRSMLPSGEVIYAQGRAGNLDPSVAAGLPGNKDYYIAYADQDEYSHAGEIVIRNGSSAYSYAVAGGYTDTQEAFMTTLSLIDDIVSAAATAVADATIQADRAEGYANSIQTMTAVTGAEGTEAAWDGVTNTLTVPKGDTGLQGEVSVVATNTIDSSSDAEVVDSNPSTNIAELTFNIPKGKSAYDVGVDNGFIGTEAEWITYNEEQSRVGNTVGNTTDNTANNTTGNTIGNTVDNTIGNTVGNNPLVEWSGTSVRFTTNDEHTEWTPLVDLQGVQGIQGNIGLNVDHVTRTDGTGAAGTIDTYTMYLDVEETLPAGTFQVTNGVDGEGTGDLISTNNLSELTDYNVARTNLGLNVLHDNVTVTQPVDLDQLGSTVNGHTTDLGIVTEALTNLADAQGTISSSTVQAIGTTETQLSWEVTHVSTDVDVFEFDDVNNYITFKKAGSYNFINTITFESGTNSPVDTTYSIRNIVDDSLIGSQAIHLEVDNGDKATVPVNTLLVLEDAQLPLTVKVMQSADVDGMSMFSFNSVLAAMEAVGNAVIYDHSGLTGTSDADSHTIGAITGLQAGLDSKFHSAILEANILKLTDGNGTTEIDLALYLDDTNLARLASGVVNSTTGIATFTRDDASTFDVDFSALLDTTIVVNDTLTSTSTTEALSANQGKQLNDTKANSADVYTKLQSDALYEPANTNIVLVGENVSQLTNDAGYTTGNDTITLSGDATGSGTTSINVTLSSDVVKAPSGILPTLDGSNLTNLPVGTEEYAISMAIALG